MQLLRSRHLPLAGSYNVRDLGGYPTRSGGTTRWRRLIRADALHRLGGAEQRELLDAGLRTVIDLRSAAELAAAPNPFQRDAGIVYLNIPLFEGLAPVSLGKGSIAPASVTTTPFSMVDRYCTALDACRAAISRTMSAIIAAEDGMVLFHCTAGKDRTGIIAALVLTAIGVAEETVIEDYALTATLARPLLDELLASAIGRGHDAARFGSVLASDPETMHATFAHLADRYGGPLQYLRTIGIDEAAALRLVSRLVEPS